MVLVEESPEVTLYPKRKLMDQNVISQKVYFIFIFLLKFMHMVQANLIVFTN